MSAAQAGDEPPIVRGYCAGGCGAYITGPYVRSVSQGASGGVDVVSGHKDCPGPQPASVAPRRHP